MSDFDVAPVVWRVTSAPEDHPTAIGRRYREQYGQWQLWLTYTRRWARSLVLGSLGEMLAAGYVLEAEPDPVPAVSEQEATD